MLILFLLSVLLLGAPLASSRLVTVYNDRPRFDVDGQFVDAHDGSLLYHGGTFYLYGEFYGNLTGRPFVPAPGWGAAPQLSVYTSPDLTTWTFRGHLFNSSVPSNASFTKWIPTALWSPACSCFVLWFGSGGWCVATSLDGVHFELASNGGTSRLGGGTDGTGILLDDDGTGYVAFSALDRGGPPPGGHLLSIERLAPDLLSSSKVNVSDFFPIDYVESPSLFKRGGRYYLLSPSCCCACRGGSGIAVYSSASILGPWALQKGDINCNDTAVEICGAFGARTAGEAGILWNAQWWSVSSIPLAGGGSALLLNGRRWLSGEGNNAQCGDLCGNGGNDAPCVNPSYELRKDLDVWLPLEFDAEGNVLPLRPLQSFTLDII
jgi:hypothetical protein